MSNSSFLTSITCRLTPTTSTLVDIVAMASKQGFTVSSISILRSFVCSFLTQLFWKRADAQMSSSQKTSKVAELLLSLCTSEWPTGTHIWLGASFLSLRILCSKFLVSLWKLQPQKSTRPLLPIQLIVKYYRIAGEWRRTSFWGQDAMKGSRKSLKILIVSKNANHLHLQLNTLFKAVKTQYLHIGPSQDGLHSQKLVFKVKIQRGRGPLGGLRGHAP